MRLNFFLSCILLLILTADVSDAGILTDAVDRDGYMWRAGECQGSPILPFLPNVTADQCLTECTNTATCLTVRYNQYINECRRQSATCDMTLNPIYNTGPGSLNAFTKYQFPAPIPTQSKQSTYDNLAYRKRTAQMQTTSLQWAYKAVDGNRNMNFGAGSCAVVNATGSIGYQWWYVDLEVNYEISSVAVMNRIDAGAPLARNFQIWINEKFNHNDVYKYNNCLCAVQDSTNPKPGQTIIYRCKNACTGRYVIIFKQPGDDENMSFCEVEVYEKNRLENVALNKPASHKPTDDVTTGFPSLATDGSTAPVMAGGSCSRTSAATNDLYWWLVDLQRIFTVRKIILYASSDLTIDKYLVRVGGEDSDPTKLDDGSAVCLQTDGTLALSANVEIFCHERTDGRYVQLIKQSASMLSLCEVEVYGHLPDENRAYLKPTEMVSAAPGSEKAVDGRINNYDAVGSCISTPTASDPGWWSVDLLLTYEVTYVIIVNRSPDSGTELSNFNIRTALTFDSANFAGTTFELCYEQTTVVPLNHIKRIFCKRPLVSRYVVVTKTPISGKVLTFCEFEVYGPLYDGNLAIGKTTVQSSTYWRYSSDLAVDGKSETLLELLSCAQTVASNKGGSWWAVDLGADYSIYKVQITNADKCCETCLRLFRVLIARTFDATNFESNAFTQCHEQSAQLDDGEIQVIFCEQTIVGRHVVVTTSGAYPLTICEVKVYERNRLENVAIRKPAKQSGNSQSHTGSADLAVDGRTLPIFSDRSCSMSCGTGELQYWFVDLLGRHRVYVITLLARADNRGFLADIEVYVAENFTESAINDQQFMTQCYKQSNDLAKGERKVIHCYRTAVGRNVVVLKHRSSFIPIILCEVQVYGVPVSDLADNVAKGKMASQSGTLIAGQTGADRAVDGVSQQLYFARTCAITDAASAVVWWQVDLTKTHIIERVGIVTKAPSQAMFACSTVSSAGMKGGSSVLRTISSQTEAKCAYECLRSRYCYISAFETASSNCMFYVQSADPLTPATGFVAFTKTCTTTPATDKLGELKNYNLYLTSQFVVGGSATVPTIQCLKTTSGVIPGDVKEVVCPEGSSGRSVVIQKMIANNDPMALCEVEVFGYPSSRQNVALNKQAMQSSGDAMFGKVVDGILNPQVSGGSCSSTASGRSDAEWWAVYLVDTYNVTDVVLVNQANGGDKLTNISIIVAENFQPNSLNALYANAYNAAQFKGTAPPPNGFSSILYWCKNQYIIPGPANAQMIPVRCDSGATGSSVVVIKHGSMVDALVLCEVQVYGTIVPPNAVVRTANSTVNAISTVNIT